MTKLSPAAYEVWAAAWDCFICDCESVEQASRRQTAAALRAVAEQGATFYWDGCPVQAVTVGSLLTIANELEAQ